MEIWKYIHGTSNAYSISNLGRVRRNTGGHGARAGRIKSYNLVGKGYYAVSLRVNKKEIKKYVHDLVLTYFVSSRPFGYVANHIDGNKLNNSIENLEWVTYSQNNQHALDMGLRVPVRGDKHPLFGVSVKDSRHPMYEKSGVSNPASKLSSSDVRRIREMWPEKTQKDIASIFGVCRYTILDIVNGRSYQDVL